MGRCIGHFNFCSLSVRDNSYINTAKHWSVAPEVNLKMGRLKNPTVLTVLLLIALLWGGSALGIVALGGGANFVLLMAVGVLLLLMPYRILKPKLGWTIVPVYVIGLLLINLAINFPVTSATGLGMHLAFYVTAFLANWLPDWFLNRPLATRHD